MHQHVLSNIYFLIYKKTRHLFPQIIFLVIFSMGILLLLAMFGEVGGDYKVYKNAQATYTENLYMETVQSFEDSKKSGDATGHGYSYFPGILYMNLIFSGIGILFGIPDYIAWKIPVLLADIGIGLLLIKIIRKENYFYLAPALLFFFLNPYLLINRVYTGYDSVPIFFMLLALYTLDRSDIESGLLFGIAVLMKTFPVILFPILLLKSKSMLKFFSSGALLGLVASIPFITSYQSFINYINGTIFVHSDRLIQGRPFIYFISYFGKIEFLRMVPVGIYSGIALIGATVIAALGAITSRFTKLDKYTLSVISFMFFFGFTPVLNRTYLLWFWPLYVLGAYFTSQKFKHSYLVFCSLLFLMWAFYFWYLFIWFEGFHIWRPEGVFFDH